MAKKIKRKLCTKKKVGYKTEMYANTRADKFTHQFHRVYRVYLCPECGNYHLTTQPETGALKPKGKKL